MTGQDPIRIEARAEVEITADARDRLARVADLLIPAGAGLPSARAAGVHKGLLDQVARARPDLVPPLLDALAALGDAPGLALVEGLATTAPDAYAALTLVVAGGYVMSPQVTEPLRYTPNETEIVDPRDTLNAVAEGLLDQVRARGPIYRVPPDAPPGHGS
ncbi:hypothetical protein [Sinosporangium siamense]|uniref:Uncharacterized protein n=1 Tax=Sinosporangium siamense TaxID=1367973 RepID=A0A919RI34_9ACTN|nr:hypothetical protein [Sinosporangium siamense]GII92789.1 hypothetical protein Ssi02_30200 [Sinosporangium siamense]